MKKYKCYIFLFLVISCYSNPDSSDPVEATKKVHYKDFTFITLSDIHYLSPLLHNMGESFINSVKDRKGNLTEYGDLILTELFNSIKEEKPHFVMITGDLTYEGEWQSHIDLAAKFKDFQNMGIQVFVIPGNHDINSPASFSYYDNKKTKVPSVTPNQFLTIYSEFGYGLNTERDMTSLSYSVNLNEEITIIGLDSCLYGENRGIIRKTTLIWLEDQLITALSNNKLPLIFLHHSLLEHYSGQNKETGNILSNRQELKQLLQKYRVKTVFTGHYHAQDIAVDTKDNSAIYDIQTGSLLNWPFLYRKIRISGNTLDIRSARLNMEILSPWAEELSYNRVLFFSMGVLQKYGLNKKNAQKVAQYVTKIFLRHILGDEEQTLPPQKPENLSLLGKLALAFGQNLYTGRLYDTGPPDNHIIINLQTGGYSEP